MKSKHKAIDPVFMTMYDGVNGGRVLYWLECSSIVLRSTGWDSYRGTTEVYITTNEAKGRSHTRCGGVPHPSRYFAWRHFCRISLVLASVLLLTKLKGNFISPQIRLEQSLFVSKLRLYTPSTIFFSFVRDFQQVALKKYIILPFLPCEMNKFQGIVHILCQQIFGTFESPSPPYQQASERGRPLC